MNKTFTIVGQGLAGTALAWTLLGRGASVLLLDRGDAVTASRVAAGLITPITGKRFALDPQFKADLAMAKAFYHEVEARTRSRFFHECGALRIFRDEEERERFAKRAAALSGFAVPQPEGFTMPHAARLDVLEYLHASREAFEELNCFRIGTFPESGTVIDCTGIAALRESRLSPDLFQPAKGEIVTLRIPGFEESRTFHRDGWLARARNDTYRAGATYTWDVLDDVPTAQGREELASRVKEIVSVPFEVIGHDAATRPITRDRQPILMQLSETRWAFNGLGSKGALLAPRLAATLAERLLA